MSVDRLSEVEAVAQRGDKLRARRLLSQILLADPRNEKAWLMLARLGETPKQVIECLEWALKINPGNTSTQRALKILRGRQSAQAQPIISQAQPAYQKPIQRGGAKAEVQAAPVEAKERLFTITPSNGVAARAPRHKLNWALIIGSLIVLGVILIAGIGPQIAPQDPMEEHAILQVGKEWFIPPFDAFKVKGYLLGSDEFGRDLLSRVLYAVRPTLTMVAVVAVVRLVLGTLIGLGAGWSTGRTGRALDVLITAALSVPILLVALAAIAMLGAELGLVAFIIGLSINGWGETARFVREQTRIIKGQLYIESAHALGASTFHMLVQHTLRQVMPMIWMLFAFEISGTLMVTAGLGFLGYFIGGDVWIEVGDFVSRRTSGAPELGQMLATSWVNLLQPWPLVLTGSVIFTTILGFNLLGDGLRTRLNPEYINRNSPLALLSQRFSLWYEEHVSYPSSRWLGANRLRPAMLVLAAGILVGSGYIFQARFSSLFSPTHSSLAIPGGQIWASERIDPYGTAYANMVGPSSPVELWKVNRPAGFSGSPAISADGTIYAATLDSRLLALNPDGSLRWEASLPVVPMGSLAISLDGNILVTDSMGGLSAFSAEGNQLWTFMSGAIGRPNHGPIVAPDGMIYCLLEDPRGDNLFALLPNGEQLWAVKPGTNGSSGALRLSPDGKQLFVKNIVLNVADGSRVEMTLPTDNSPVLANKAILFVGADGKTYLLAGHVVMEWEQSSQGFTLVRSADWDYRALGFVQTSSFPFDAIVTPHGNILLIYSGFYGATQVIWLDATGKFLGTSHAPIYQGTHIVAADIDENITLCGVGATEQGSYTSVCETLKPDSDLPLWRYNLGVEDGGVIGAAMAPGRLYAITGDGTLTALGSPAGTETAPTEIP